MSIPSTFKALKTIPGGKMQVETVSGFASLKENADLGADFVLVRTLAVGLNPTDWKACLGATPPDESVVVGCDGSGEVVAVGSNVTHVAKGDRVFAFVVGNLDPNNGSFSEYVRYNKAIVAKIPESMSALEGASFPIPHFTAVQFLFLRLNLARPSAPSTEGKTILIWGGATSVGHQTVQLAALSGYKVITTASPCNHDSLLALGASAVFNYRDANVVDQIKAAAGKDGVSFAIDGFGEAETTASCIDAIGPQGGRVIAVLPTSKENATRRSDVNAEFYSVYLLTGNPVDLPGLGEFHYPAEPADNAGAVEWVTNELPPLLEGWKTSEGGSKKLRSQKLRVGKAGLGGILEGLETMKAGGYKAEKLVFSLV